MASTSRAITLAIPFLITLFVVVHSKTLWDKGGVGRAATESTIKPLLLDMGLKQEPCATDMECQKRAKEKYGSELSILSPCGQRYAIWE